jgi:glutathione S-transferase
MLRHGSFGMLTVHHLGKSQSERIVWLCEELGIPYELKRYERVAVTMLAPPEYKALHPLGAAPVIVDGDVVLAESAAIIEYIAAKHGNGRLALAADHADFAAFLYWFHFANGTLQPALGRNMILGRLRLAEDNPILRAIRAGSTSRSVCSRRASARWRISPDTNSRRPTS